MTDADVLRIFEECGALLRGHFVLSSGRHADTYFNKSVVSKFPRPTEKLCRALAARIADRFGEQAEAVISPAMGAIIFGYETARHLQRPFMFLEREKGAFALRRGFSIRGQKVIVVEDIVSTGLSSRESLAAVRAAGGRPLGLACLLDRSGGKASLDVPVLALATLNVESWPADALPPHLRGVPVMKPGSRGIA